MHVNTPLLKIMKHTTGFVTVTEALERVFLRHSQSNSLRPLCVAPNSRLLRAQYVQSSRLHQFRHASTSRMGGNLVRTYGPNAVTASGSTNISGDKPPFRPDRPPRDQEIKAYKVYVVHPETQRLSEPHILGDVLNELQRDEKNHTTQYIQQVAPADEEADPPRYYPIVKMFDKKLEREREIERRKAGKEKKQQTKQLEVSWTIGDGDLGHRLGRLKEFLGKGWKVELLFGVKRKGWNQKREPTPEEIVKVLEKIREAIKEVEGAKEWRGMQGKEGGEAILYFDGKMK